MDPILIDERLSPKLGSVARERGLVAFHALWVGMAGAEDWDLAALTAEWDDIIVTNKRRDFRCPHAQLEVHDGLIIIVPTVSTDEQTRLFEVALDIADQQDTLINLLIAVHIDGSTEVRNWSKDDPAGAD